MQELEVIILGASGHGRVIQSIIQSAGFGFAGFYDDEASSCRDSASYLGSFADLSERSQDVFYVVGVGDNRIRRVIVEKMGYLPYTPLVHPSATIAPDAVIGEGSVVMPGAILNPGSKVGRHCVVNTGAILEHDCEMDDFSSLGPGVAVGGDVHIGEESFIGIGATLSHGITVGAQSLIGAGAVVIKNLPDRVVAVGVPARIVRERTDGERYL